MKLIQLEYIADDQIGLEKIKKLISNNLFKPLINKQLLTHQGAIPKSILLHGPEGTGKLTMVKYIANQLNWNVLPFDWIDMICTSSYETKKTLLDSYIYWFNNSKTILLIKNMETVLNMDNDEMESLWLKKTILSTFKELLIKFQHTE